MQKCHPCSVLVLTRSCAFAGKMYACQYCDAVFAQSIELSRHVRTHTGDKPYVCRDCGKGFRQANGLSIHLHTFHSTYCRRSVRHRRPCLALRRPVTVLTGQSLHQSWAPHSGPYPPSVVKPSVPPEHVSVCVLLLCPACLFSSPHSVWLAEAN